MALREPPSDRAPYAGDAKRERPVLEKTDFGPLHAMVTVVPVRIESQWADVVFSVEAEWNGPGLPELPPTDQPVLARDTFAVGELELARAVARAAIDELRAGNVPDLRELARRFA